MVTIGMATIPSLVQYLRQSRRSARLAERPRPGRGRLGDGRVAGGMGGEGH